LPGGASARPRPRLRLSARPRRGRLAPGADAPGGGGSPLPRAVGPRRGGRAARAARRDQAAAGQTGVSNTPRMPRSFGGRLAIAGVLAFAARAVVALAVAPDSLTHSGDPRYFHLAANLLADGHGYIAPLPFLNSGHSIPSAEHP